MPTKTDRDTERGTKGLLALDPVEELTLTFSPGPDGDFIVTGASSEGEAQGRFHPPWSDRHLKRLYRRRGRTARNTRPASTETEPDWDPWREGRRLHDALFATPALRDLFEATRAASGSRHFRLRVVLDPDQPEARVLHSIPWELIFWRDRGEVTSLSEGSSVVRSLMVRGQPRHFEAKRRLRVLMISSGARDLDLETERRRIEETAGATRRLEFGAERVTDLSTLQRLLETARAAGRPVHVLHLAGHGDLDSGPAGGSLRWEMPDGATLDLPGRGLATLLRAHPSIQLVVLNACHTGELPAGEGDPFSGVASALLQAGAPAVIAAQGEIDDDEAILFAGVFYARLAEGDLPEAAMARARHELFLKGPERGGWLKPILFLATPRPGIPRRLVHRIAAVLMALALSVVLLLAVVRWQHCRGQARGLETAVNGSVALLEDGRAAEALAEVVRAAEEARCPSIPPPLRAAAYATAGLAAQATGDPDHALRRTAEAIRLDPEHVPHRIQHAVLLVRSGRADDSVRVLLDAIELDPGSAEAHGVLASVYLDLERPEDARKALADALAIQPTDGLLHTTLGRTHLRLDQPVEAAAAFRYALDHLPRQQIDPRADAAFGLVEAARASEVPGTLCAALAEFHSEDPDGVTEHALDVERLAVETPCEGSVPPTGGTDAS